MEISNSAIASRSCRMARASPGQCATTHRARCTLPIDLRKWGDDPMFGKRLLGLLLPLALAASLGACNESSGAVQPGVVNTAAPDGYRGEQGRVVAINETRLRGGGSGIND